MGRYPEERERHAIETTEVEACRESKAESLGQLSKGARKGGPKRPAQLPSSSHRLTRRSAKEPLRWCGARLFYAPISLFIFSSLAADFSPQPYENTW